jgi:NADPH2:quinone reductase
MPQAILLREHGGPEVLRVEDIAVAAPGPGEVRIRQTAVGVNFHDCYVRSGLYQTLKLPGIPGLEAAGMVIAVGDSVAGFAPGDRVAYFFAAYGSYASERVIGADRLVKIPNGVNDATAASLMIKGLTALMLVKHVHALGPDDTILVHAAAGGVGLLLSQWAKHLGARVIGTAGSPEKAALAKQAGCEEVILYRSEDFVARVKDLTGGKGVSVAYDSVGKDTFYGSMECLADLGHLVNFGQSSGPIDPMAVSLLSKGSYTLTRPMLFHYCATRPALEAMAAELFAAIADGTLSVAEPATLPLTEAGEAHRRLEARETTGALVLTV